MAYNFYNLGIVGAEIKRRLEMLKNITGENSVADKDYVEESINNAINNKNQDGTAYLDAGNVTQLTSMEADINE